MKYKIVVTVVITLLFNSCNLFNQEDPLKKERKEIEEIVESTTASIYKSTKLLVKTIPADLEEMENDMNKENADKLKLLTFMLGLQTANGALGPDSLSTDDVVNLYQIFIEMRETMNQLEEDDLPPLLPALAYVSAQATNIAILMAAASTGGHMQGLGNFMIVPDKTLPRWNNNYEHTLLAALMVSKIAPAPSSCNIYEAYMIDISSFTPNEYKTLGTWVKAMVYQQNEWNYTSEKILTGALNDIEEGRIKPEGNFSFLTLQQSSGKQMVLDDLTATTHLLRGISRTVMDVEEKKKEGMEDFYIFLDHAKKLGLDNELIWLLEIYLSLEAGDVEKATEGLKRLRGSKWIGKNEKEIIDKTMKYLSKRDTESAFNYFSDKTFMTSVISKYAFEHFKNTKVYLDLENSDGGQLLMDFPSLFSAAYKKVVPLEEMGEVKDKLLDFLE